MDISQQILSKIIIFMKYSRYLETEKRRETWEEIVTRNKNMHIKKFPHIKEEIEEVYKMVYDKKVLPSMRGLQFAGRAMEINPSRMFNCCALSMNHWKAFSEIMHLLLTGAGCGFSVQQQHISKLPTIKKPTGQKRRYLVPDSIEGWAESIKMLCKSYFDINGNSKIEFDFSDIRQKGSILITSGGKAPGAQPLIECITHIKGIFESIKDGERLTSLNVHDINCFIANAVLAGGIRRASMISLFSIEDEEMLNCKSDGWWEKNPQRALANNSVVLKRGEVKQEQFNSVFERIEYSNCGEPGIFWTNDYDMLTNPCGEIALKSNMVCNLTEVNVSDITSQEDLNERVRVASFIGTLQSSYTQFHYLRTIWQSNCEKEPLLGISMTGICAGEVFKYDMKEAAKQAIYENTLVADKIGINSALRLTCVKPAGTTSLVLGTSSGIHAYFAPYYIRRVRVNRDESIYQYLLKNNPELLEEDKFNTKASIISIPQKAPDNAIVRGETVIEQCERIKKFNLEWIRPGYIEGVNYHNVSATVYVQKREWQTVRDWMWDNREFYTGISLLPMDNGSYVQPPYSEITKEKYEEMFKLLKQIDLSQIKEYENNVQLTAEPACSGNSCELR